MLKMLFDSLIKIIEKQESVFIEPFRSMIDNARIFDFRNDGDVTFDKRGIDNKDEICNFFLPYKTIAIISLNRYPHAHATKEAVEHPYLVVLSDGKKRKKGLKGNRDFVILSRSDLCWGKVDLALPGDVVLQGEGTLQNEEYLPNDDPDLSKWADMFLVDAVNKIKRINNANLLILEESPVKQKQSTKKIKRSHQRPKYTVLSPKVIREKMRIKQQTNSKSSHERRAHIRYYRSEKFSENGTLPVKYCPNGLPYYKRTFVESTWVGEKEKIVGNKKYRVILDR